MGVVVEDASSKDLERLWNIEKECFKEEAFTKQQLSQLLKDYNTVSLVARKQDEIAGFVIGMIYFEREALHGHILTIDIGHVYRRKGFGRLLMNEIETIFKLKGAKASYLEVREDNAPAIGLYLNLGYKIIGKLDNYYGKVHGIYLRKLLV
ncbi:MAG TPA: GNAT family N-acetyltransferase [Patescibacteria group bacterium]|nr:GNAT family N-acetyltransferase [Patescibacteria group bacterium]